MRPGVHFLQLLDTDLGIDLCCIQFGVPEQLLNKADVCAVLQHVRCAAVTKQVATALASDLGLLNTAAHASTATVPAIARSLSTTKATASALQHHWTSLPTTGTQASNKQSYS